jgi:hypothetical protein
MKKQIRFDDAEVIKPVHGNIVVARVNGFQQIILSNR